MLLLLTAVAALVGPHNSCGHTRAVSDNKDRGRILQQFDVVIAGAGPAGLAAAESVAQSGASVLIVEQNREIGSPARTTGGSFIQDMQDLGIPARLYHPIRRCRYISPNNSVTFDYPDPVTCVLDVRGVFQFLAERAIEAGAKISVGATAGEPLLTNAVVTGVHIKTATEPNNIVNSKILIDATGYRSQLLKQSAVSPGSKRFGVGSEYDLYAPHCNQDEAVLIVGSQIAPAGYAWVFPWGRKRVRAGVGILHTDSAEHPDKYLDVLLSRAAEFGVDLRGAQPVEYHYGLVPSDGVLDTFTGDGIMAIGDSAGQACALVGEGIRWAIRAGRMAGAVAGQAFQANDFSRSFLGRYQKEWNAKFGRNLRLAYQINRRIARWDDAEWDRKTELLKLFTPYQFGQALQANFTAGWTSQLLWSHPRLLKEGFKELAGRFI
jgi:digeranylgeranylglycerophospholipid reductase